MARVLRRPMFRLGGNTDQGIMSGVAPRQGYAAAGSVEDMERRKEILRAGVGKTPDRSGLDFAIDWGLGMVSGTPKGNIFATAAEQAKEPLQKFRQAKADERSFERQIGLTAATSSLEQMDEIKRIAMKNLNKDDRLDLDKIAQRAFDQGLYNSFDEAWIDLYNKKYRYSKAYTKSPEAEYQAAIETMTEFIQEEDILANPFDAKDLAETAWRISNEDKFKDVASDFDKDIIVIQSGDLGQSQGEGVFDTNLGTDSPDYKHNGIYIKWPEKDLYRYNSTSKTFHLYTFEE